MTRDMSSTTARVLKALSVFGGVQVIGILCSVVRTKLAALWLGPVGVGMLAIFNSTLDLISQTTQLNIQQSAVRDLAACRANPHESAVLTAAVRRLSLLLGIAAMIALAILSPLVSRWTFGDSSHALSYVALSVWLLFIAVGGTEMAIMRANDRLAPLARASIFTAVTGVVSAVPLFYFFRLGAVVPVLLVYAMSQCVYSLVFAAPRVRVSLSLGEVWRRMRGVLSLGFYMTVSTSVTLLASNIFVVWLNRTVSEADVGFYQAGYTIINTYVGMIFTAIAMEYYPRLSAVGSSVRRMEPLVSHEIKIALWVLIPVVVLFICLSSLIVRILYSPAFEVSLPFVLYGAGGVFFRAASWCLAYTILARGDGRMFILTEVSSAVIFLALYIPMFRAFGYEGLGIAYVLWYAAYFAVTYAVFRFRYGMRLRKGIAVLLCLAVAVGGATLALYHAIGPWWTLCVMLPPAAWMSYGRLRSRR